MGYAVVRDVLNQLSFAELDHCVHCKVELYLVADENKVILIDFMSVYMMKRQIWGSTALQLQNGTFPAVFILLY